LKVKKSPLKSSRKLRRFIANKFRGGSPVGSHPAWRARSIANLCRTQIQACSEVGIISIRKTLPLTISETELYKIVDELNMDPTVDGILVQLPLPPHINSVKITQHNFPGQDRSFHPLNVGRMLIGETDVFMLVLLGIC